MKVNFTKDKLPEKLTAWKSKCLGNYLIKRLTACQEDKLTRRLTVQKDNCMED